MPDLPSRIISFDTTEGTFMNVDVSPDGEKLIFDLLGDLYWLPIEGGDAIPLTIGRVWDRAPRFSPDGKQVYFVSDREGYNSLWRLTLSDGSLQPITHSDSNILGGLNWSQDRTRLLAGRVDADTGHVEVILQSIDPNTGHMTPIDAPSEPWIDMDTFETFRPRIKVYSGAQSVDGEVFFSQAKFDQEQRRWTIHLHKFDIRTQARSTITPLHEPYNDYRPLLSHDGRLLAYFRQYPDRRTEVRILNRMTGQDDALISLTNADDPAYGASYESRPNYAFTPDDRQLVFWHHGKIHRANVTDGSIEIIPFRVAVEREVWARAEPTVKRLNETGEASVVRWPSLSNAGQTMAFSAVGYVWLMNLQTGVVRRLTRSNSFEYMPAISPDGRFVVYTSFDGTEGEQRSSRLMVADVGDGGTRELLVAPNETYLIPKWSQDGSMIALIREVQSESGPLKAAFGWMLAAGGPFHKVAAAPASDDRMSFYIFSRFVGFDRAGRNLLFSFRRPGNGAILAAASLDDRTTTTLAIGTSEVGGITPAPDLRNLALTRHDGVVWTSPFNASLEEQLVTTSSLDARRVSAGGGYYVDWNRLDQFTFGFGKNVYRQKVGESELEFHRVELAFEKPRPTQPIAFTRARLITFSSDAGAGSVIESGTVVIDGARITAIGPAKDIVIPDEAVVVDIPGRTIMPGLLDTHYHRIGGFNLSALALPNPEFGDPTAIAYGVTTAWEPGASPNDGVPATVDLQTAGRILGPRWSHSAVGAIGYPYEQLTTYGAAFEAVEQHRELGVAVLKEYTTPTRQQRQWLSAAAHQQNLGIVSHIGTLEGMLTGIVDGFTGGDHSYIPIPFFKDVHELLLQTGYIWTPNIVISNSTLGRSTDGRSYHWQHLSEKRPHELGKLETMTSANRFDRIVNAQSSASYDTHRVSRVAKQSASAAKNGAKIGVSAHNMPGLFLHAEMWHLWRGGMCIEDVLRATTIGNAEKLGLQEEVGSLEVGKMADFLVLDENPLDDILNTVSLKYTVQGGVVYDSATAQRVDLNSLRE